MGSGAAAFDFDGSGRLGFLILNNAGPNSSSTNKLFRQLPDKTFQDVSAGSGLDIAGYNMGVAIADVNNDGMPDVLITQFGGLKLFLNLGGGKFKDVTQEACLDSPLWGTSAAFFDYDRDGFLDLVVVNYLEFDPTRICEREGRGVRLLPAAHFQQAGREALSQCSSAAGQPAWFRQVSGRHAGVGVGQTCGDRAGVVALDFTGDGWPDIFVANDAHSNYLWVNRHDGTFAEEAIQRGLAYNRLGQAQANMGIAIGDVDGGGMFGVFVTHEHASITSSGSKVRVDFSRIGPRRLASPSPPGEAPGSASSWLTLIRMAISTWHSSTARCSMAWWSRTRKSTRPRFGMTTSRRNQLFINDGKGTFLDVSAVNTPFSGKALVSPGLVWGDFDGDGAIDLLVTTVAGPALLYRNVAPKKGHWLMVRAIDPTRGGRDAIGAEIIVNAGGRKWLGWINPAGSYLCSNDPCATSGSALWIRSTSFR